MNYNAKTAEEMLETDYPIKLCAILLNHINPNHNEKTTLPEMEKYYEYSNFLSISTVLNNSYLFLWTNQIV